MTRTELFEIFENGHFANPSTKLDWAARFEAAWTEYLKANPRADRVATTRHFHAVCEGQATL